MFVCVLVCCGRQYAVCVCVSMLWTAVRCMCVSVCCQKRGKMERGKENSMEGEDNDKQGEGKGRRKDVIRV